MLTLSRCPCSWAPHPLGNKPERACFAAVTRGGLRSTGSARAYVNIVEGGTAIQPLSHLELLSPNQRQPLSPATLFWHKSPRPATTTGIIASTAAWRWPGSLIIDAPGHAARFFVVQLQWSMLVLASMLSVSVAGAYSTWMSWMSGCHGLNVRSTGLA